MPYDRRLVAAFNKTLGTEPRCQQIAPGKILYRGGERPDANAFLIRSGNVFLSSYPAYARPYAGFWQIHDYHYLYRAVTTREIRVAVVYGMQSVVSVALDELKLIHNSEVNSWQRDNLIPLAIQSLNQQVDGILFLDRENTTTDEFLIDNRNETLNLQELYIFHKDRRNPQRENAVLSTGR
ncbi:hypothetical protein PQI07_37630 [Methylobacterium sp. 092160098-2]|uniref:hypothetical protein n=1 Tax=Methylobacterium sp. 092160098-2 TaxID=3025129 RepID=UPI002381D0C9|nr:hypothetical protein [Methylobacterium sp. 092160098-2]MDE4916285.1 hypothetical protein [Methylobacterium sp. 092160098-2]